MTPNRTLLRTNFSAISPTILYWKYKSILQREPDSQEINKIFNKIMGGIVYEAYYEITCVVQGN